jgi:pimeloyl-ACP methyl ester carboxylesterase
VLRFVTGKPVVVLSAIDTPNSDAVRHANKKRADIAHLYPGSRQVWVQSGHYIQWDRPEVVVDAIRGMLR